jgi:hypothetical protein
MKTRGNLQRWLSRGAVNHPGDLPGLRFGLSLGHHRSEPHRDSMGSHGIRGEASSRESPGASSSIWKRVSYPARPDLQGSRVETVSEKEYNPVAGSGWSSRPSRLTEGFSTPVTLKDTL